jgi:hypothetical protein
MLLVDPLRWTENVQLSKGLANYNVLIIVQRLCRPDPAFSTRSRRQRFLRRNVKLRNFDACFVGAASANCQQIVKSFNPEFRRLRSGRELHCVMDLRCKPMAGRNQGWAAEHNRVRTCFCGWA